MKKLISNRKLKLTTLLTSLVSASVIFTTLILLFASYQSEKEALTDTYLSLNYSKSDKLSSSVDSVFRSMRTSLEETTAFLTEKEELTDEEIQEQLELLRNTSSYFNSIAWVDETGLIRNIAPLSIGLKGEIIKSGVSKEVLDSKRAALTEPYIATSGRLIILMSEPLYDNLGNYKGIIGGTVYLQEQNILNQILGNDIVDNSGSYYYVVGPGGKLLFHPDSNRIGEAPTENPVIRKLIDGESGMKRVTNTKGIPMLAAYSIVPETGWGVVQQTPVLYINEVLFDRIQKLILYMLPPFFLLLVLSIYLARKLAEPFITLAEHVNQLASGQVVSVPVIQSHWNREADILAKSTTIAIEAVQKNNYKLIHAATTDPLTELPNRRKLNETMESWRSEGLVFSLIAIDIDRFKLINDTYGHQDGDKVLKFLADTIQTIVRKTDICFRYGGEEFVLLLPHTTSLEAYNIAEKIRLILENTNSSVGKPITISLGISEYPLHSSSLDELFSLADKALYQSKLEGRNRTTIGS
jgi:diguanylate cyclase (GGDEF)-like protein